MQFISYDSDDAESSESLPESDKKARSIPTEVTANSLAAFLKPSWAVESSSDEDSDNEANSNSNAPEDGNKDNKSGLLDAETLFASTTSKPKFLSRNIDDKFEVSAVKVHSYDDIESSVPLKYKKKNDSVGSTTRAVPMTSLTTKLTIAKTGEPVSESDLALKKKLDDRETAKVQIDVPDSVSIRRLCGRL